MADWWRSLSSDRRPLALAERVRLEEWCGTGVGGIVLVVVGMKYWRGSITENSLPEWVTVLEEMQALFSEIHKTS